MGEVSKDLELLCPTVKLIFDEKCITICNPICVEVENENATVITLEDCLKEAIKNGYTSKSTTLIVFAENYTSGNVYRYGNYTGSDWHEIGKLYGFV